MSKANKKQKKILDVIGRSLPSSGDLRIGMPGVISLGDDIGKIVMGADGSSEVQLTKEAMDVLMNSVEPQRHDVSQDFIDRLECDFGDVYDDLALDPLEVEAGPLIVSIGDPRTRESIEEITFTQSVTLKLRK
jgi:hypothetical protein